MDGSISFKPTHPAVSKTLAARDPVTVREAVATDLGGAKTVAAAGDGGARNHDRRPDDPRGDQPDQDHAPRDLLDDPASREVIYRERDVRAADREHPDQALLRQRAYRPAATAPAGDAALPAPDPHADIKA